MMSLTALTRPYEVVSPATSVSASDSAVAAAFSCSSRWHGEATSDRSWFRSHTRADSTALDKMSTLVIHPGESSYNNVTNFKVFNTFWPGKLCLTHFLSVLSCFEHRKLVECAHSRILALILIIIYSIYLKKETKWPSNLSLVIPCIHPYMAIYQRIC